MEALERVGLLDGHHSVLLALLSLLRPLSPALSGVFQDVSHL